MSTDKKNIRNTVARAVKSGRLHKPAHCEHCGRHVPRNTPHALQAHHEDYSKPLDIEWLCYLCHPLKDALRQMKWVFEIPEGSAHYDRLAPMRNGLHKALLELQKREGPPEAP